MAAFVCPFLVCRANKTQVNLRLISAPTCRMRNAEGFQLPPRVPSDPAELRRAIELLGCCTQRKRMRSATATELESLVGQFPPNRLLAQQWKGAIQRDLQRANRNRAPTAFKHRQQLMHTLTLSESNRSVSRCFILLEAVRRRYLANEAPNPKALQELNKLLGCFPKSSLEAHRFIRALARMQRDRRLYEKNPPQIPVENLAELYEASMLLGSYAVRGTVGRQTGKLESLLGTIPRNKNIAHSWQKVIKAAIRKENRKQQKEQRRREIENKRFERQLRKLMKKHFTTAETHTICASSQPEKHPFVQEVNPVKHFVVDNDRNKQTKSPSFMSKLSKFFASFLVRKG